MANFLNPEDYGLMSMASFLTAYIDFLSDLGIGAAIVQKNQINNNELSSLFWLSGSTGFLLSIITFGLAYPTAFIFNEPRIVPVTSLISLVFIIGSLSSIPNGILRRDFKFKQIGSINLIGAIVSCLFQLYFASQGWGVYTLVFGVIILRATKTILSFYVANWFPSFNFSFSEVKPFLKFGIGLMFGTFIYRIYQSIDKLIIGKKFGATLLGSYGFSSELASLPTDKVMPVFHQVTFPLLARIQNDIDDRNKTYLNNLKYCLYLCAPLFIGGVSMGQDIINGFLGQKWLSISTMFSIFCIVKLFELIRSFTNILYTSAGDSKTPLLFSILLLLIMPASIFLTISHFGYQYIMIPWVTILPIMSSAWILFSLKKFSIGIKQFLFFIFKPLLFGFLFSACSLFAKSILTPIEPILPHTRIFVICYLSIGILITLLFFPLFEKTGINNLIKTLRLKPSLNSDLIKE